MYLSKKRERHAELRIVSGTTRGGWKRDGKKRRGRERERKRRMHGPFFDSSRIIEHEFSGHERFPHSEGTACRRWLVLSRSDFDHIALTLSGSTQRRHRYMYTWCGLIPIIRSGNSRVLPGKYVRSMRDITRGSTFRFREIRRILAADKVLSNL